MRNIWLILKNNFYRLTKEKMLIFMMVVVMPIVIYFGVFFGNLDDFKGTIAVVGATEEQESNLKNLRFGNNISFEFLKEEPSNTALIRGIYLSEILFEKDEVKVISYGNEEFRKVIDAAIRGEVYELKEQKTSTEGKIIGFLMMFSFFGGAMIMDFLLTDRENKTYMRVLLGRISYYEYIIGQIVYSIVVLTVPSIIISLVVLKILSVQLAITIGTFVCILLLMGLLISSTSVLICTLCKSKATAPIVISSVAMITSLLGGCIINISDDNKIMAVIRDLIPQKRILDLVDNYNQKDLVFIFAVILIFILASVIIGKKQCDRGEFV